MAEHAGRHENEDADVSLLAKLGLLGAVVTVAVVVAMLFLFRAIVDRERARDTPPSPLAATPSPFTGPRLQVDPAGDRDEVFAAEREVLESYGWVDREAGVVRIPIERAIDLLAERGLPAREAER